jgi:hypothetical protein
MDSVLLEAWRPIARLDANVLLCVATPLHLVVPKGHQAHGTPEYPAPPEADLLFRKHRPLDPGAALGLLFTDNTLGIEPRYRRQPDCRQGLPARRQPSVLSLK